MEEPFENHRSYLFAIAYRMLGSAMDAEDVVQETYIRYQAAKPETIHSLKAYLTTILTRLCLDQLDLVRRKRSRWRFWSCWSSSNRSSERSSSCAKSSSTS